MAKRKDESWESRINTLHMELAAIRERFMLPDKKLKVETVTKEEVIVDATPIQEVEPNKAEEKEVDLHQEKEDDDEIPVIIPPPPSSKKKCLYTEVVDLVSPSPSPSPSPSSSPRFRPALPDVIILPQPPPKATDAPRAAPAHAPTPTPPKQATDPTSSRPCPSDPTSTRTRPVRSCRSSPPEAGDAAGSAPRRGRSSRTDPASASPAASVDKPPPAERSSRAAAAAAAVRKDRDLPPPRPKSPTRRAPPVPRAIPRNRDQVPPIPSRSPASVKQHQSPSPPDLSSPATPADSPTAAPLHKSTLHGFVSVFYPVLKDVPDWASGPYQEFKDDSIRLCNKCLSLCEWIYFLTSKDKELCAKCVKEEGGCSSSKTFLREGVVQYLSALDSAASTVLSVPAEEEAEGDDGREARTHLCMLRKAISSSYERDETSAVSLQAFVQGYNASNAQKISEKVAVVALDLLGFRPDSSGLLQGLKAR